MIVEFEHYFGPFLTSTTEEILNDRCVGHGNRMMFYISVYVTPSSMGLD